MAQQNESLKASLFPNLISQFTFTQYPRLLEYCTCSPTLPNVHTVSITIFFFCQILPKMFLCVNRVRIPLVCLCKLLVIFTCNNSLVSLTHTHCFNAGSLHLILKYANCFHADQHSASIKTLNKSNKSNIVWPVYYVTFRYIQCIAISAGLACKIILEFKNNWI